MRSQCQCFAEGFLHLGGADGKDGHFAACFLGELERGFQCGFIPTADHPTDALLHNFSILDLDVQGDVRYLLDWYDDLHLFPMLDGPMLIACPEDSDRR